MGKCESAKVSIGLKIKLGDLIEQINEENIEELKIIFSDGFIEDKNEEFSYMLMIIYEELYLEFFVEKKKKKASKKKSDKENELEHNKEEKEIKINEFKIKFIEESKKKGTIEKGCLYDQFLLYPVKSLLETDRWGYDREGTNGSSCELDFDIEKIKSDIKEKYDFIQGFKVVMMIKQHSG